MKTNLKQQKRERNHRKIRAKIAGTAELPRLAIFKSNTAISAQVINDDLGVTLAAARGKDAEKVGAEVAKAAMAKKVEAVVFDRGGYVYTGKVRGLADAARKAGLKF